LLSIKPDSNCPANASTVTDGRVTLASFGVRLDFGEKLSPVLTEHPVPYEQKSPVCRLASATFLSVMMSLLRSDDGVGAMPSHGMLRSARDMISETKRFQFQDRPTACADPH
jgi:hypothetical protein